MPAPFTLPELLATPSPDQIRAKFLAFLGADTNPSSPGAAFAHGFPVADWLSNPDGPEMAFVNMVRSGLFDLIESKQSAQIASGWLAKATRLRLSYHAKKFYLIDRNPATRTTFNLALSSTASAPPYDWQVGDVVVAGASGLRYVSTTGGSLQPGETLLVSFQAEAPGAVYNDNLSDGLTLVTAFAGVSASAAVGDFTEPVQSGDGTGHLAVARLDPLIDPTPGTYVFRIDTAGDPGVAQFSLSANGGPFYPQGLLTAVGSASPYGFNVAGVIGAGSPTSFLVGDTYTVVSPGGTAYVQGSDEESDASLVVRCQARWPSLSFNQTQDVFRLWAKLAYPPANRVSVRAHPLAPGRVEILVADSNGTIDPQSAAAITAYIQPKLGDVLASVTVGGARDLPIYTGGTVTVAGSLRTSVQQIAQQLWTTHLSTVEIGGVLILAELEQALMDAGAIDVQGLQIEGVAANVPLSRDQVPVARSLAEDLVWANA